jgi:hypothetical protein
MTPVRIDSYRACLNKPTKCEKNIVVACCANDRTDHGAGSGVQACPCTVMVGLTDHATSMTDL